MRKSRLGFKYNLKADSNRDESLKFSSFLKLMSSNNLPDNVNLIPKFNPVENQNSLGSCSSFSTGSVLEFLYDLPFISSKLFSYYNGRLLSNDEQTDSGCSLEDMCNQLKIYGMCSNKKWSYDTSKFNIKPTKECYDEGLNYRASECYRVENLYEAKVALSIGLPVCIGISVYESFESDKCLYTGRIPSPSGDKLGLHAVVINGYTNNNHNKFDILNLFRNNSTTDYYIRNSWGVVDDNNRRIGLKDYPGHFIIDEDTLGLLLVDSWVIIANSKNKDL